MKLILCGGGWGKKTIIPNKAFEGIIDPSKPILYIPVAREKRAPAYQDCTEWLLNEFSGITHGPIDTIESTDSIANIDLSAYTAIFIGGGNTYKLLKELKDSGAMQDIINYINNGGIIYGCSAGAIVFGQNINCCSYEDSNDVGLKDMRGFDLIFGCNLSAHYMNADDQTNEIATKLLSEQSCITPVIALPEEDSLYINGDSIQIIGTQNFCVFNHANKQYLPPNVVYSKQDFIKLISNVKI